MKVKIEKLRENAKLPTKANKDDAGFDCYISQFCWYNNASRKLQDYSVEKTKEIRLQQGKIIGCKLGFKTELPKGYYAKVVPRSGLALKHGITIVNSPGTIDCGYRGEWIVIVSILRNGPYTMRIGDKICQFIIDKLVPTELVKIERDIVQESSLNKSERGEGGFGSSGK